MATDTHKYDKARPEARHSAFEEFERDERRPAVLLLGALILAALFFALGIIFDRWTTGKISSPRPPSNHSTPAATQSPAPPAAAQPSNR